MSKVSKSEKARRRRIMAEIDQKADCGGHNRSVSYAPDPMPGGVLGGDLLSLYLLTRMATKRRNRR